MNAAQHRFIGVVGVTMATLTEEHKNTGTISEESFISFIVAYNTSSLPDLIEPATNPRHRAFFHSMSFALGLGYGVFKLYQWQPENNFQRWSRRILIALGISYLIHLLVDSSTPMGIPII